MPDKRSLCIVFDLDDTIYLERDYQLSGFRAVAEHCKLIFGRDVLDSILEWDANGEPNIFGRLCSMLGLPASCKESFIWLYRNHLPDISLTESTKQAVRKIGKLSSSVAILTDGRSVTQRMKLRALGLADVPVYISEEWEDSKPGKVRFEAIEKRFQADNYWYIGDNPKKDFLAPNQLGWGSVGLRDCGANIHSQELTQLSAEYLPTYWIDSLSEVTDLIWTHYDFQMRSK